MRIDIFQAADDSAILQDGQVRRRMISQPDRVLEIMTGFLSNQRIRGLLKEADDKISSSLSKITADCIKS